MAILVVIALYHGLAIVPIDLPDMATCLAAKKQLESQNKSGWFSNVDLRCSCIDVPLED